MLNFILIVSGLILTLGATESDSLVSMLVIGLIGLSMLLAGAYLIKMDEV